MPSRRIVRLERYLVQVNQLISITYQLIFLGVPIPSSLQSTLLLELLERPPEGEHRVRRRRETELPVLVQALLLIVEIQTQTEIVNQTILAHYFNCSQSN